VGDVGMIQGSQHFRFALKPREPIRVGRERGGQNLDGDLSFELRVRRAVDLTHSAFADERSDFVGAEARAGREGQWWRLYGRDGPMELAALKCSRHRLDRRRCSTVMGYLRVHRRCGCRVRPPCHEMPRFQPFA
jgi:hypothetical protein